MCCVWLPTHLHFYLFKKEKKRTVRGRRAPLEKKTHDRQRDEGERVCIADR